MQNTDIQLLFNLFSKNAFNIEIGWQALFVFADDFCLLIV